MDLSHLRELSLSINFPRVVDNVIGDEGCLYLSQGKWTNLKVLTLGKDDSTQMTITSLKRDVNTSQRLSGIIWNALVWVLYR